MVLEIACFSLKGVETAVASGANRVELCENALAGGTTPSYGFLKTARVMADLPMFPIIRPRGGDFCYSTPEFEAMKLDINICKSIGFDGVVLGILHPDGTIDEVRTAALIALAYPMEVTFHRAFDRCVEPLAALETLVELGVNRILTSGRQPTALEGAENLSNLVTAANHRLIVMPGGSINSTNLANIIRHTNAVEYHAACRKQGVSAMIDGDAAQLGEGNYTMVDGDEVRLLCEILSLSA